MKEINDSLLNKAIRNFNIALKIYQEDAVEDEMYLNWKVLSPFFKEEAQKCGLR